MRQNHTFLIRHDATQCKTHERLLASFRFKNLRRKVFFCSAVWIKSVMHSMSASLYFILTHSDNQSVISHHGNTTSSSGTLRRLCFSNVKYTFVSFEGTVRCQPFLLSDLSHSRSHHMNDTRMTADSFLFLCDFLVASCNLFCLAVVHHKFVPIFLNNTK